ncbi:hypothetical protein N499_0998A, partial [Wolbachia pipientis wVitA]
MKIQL